MIIEQIYTGCLAEAAYYIESNGEAAVIDPLRESEPYTSRLDASGATLKYVFETHFHADFVSGHIDLAKKTGAEIVYGPMATPEFKATIAKDGQIFKIGDITIEVLHTPGHTMESSTYLLRDARGVEKAIFTGDTLFLGDVGRPDLAIKSDVTQEDLAGHLYDSLRTKIMPLSDDIIVYPGHGAGSSCGKKLSDETVDTLGHQKLTNYALRVDMTKEEFVKEVTDGLLPPPQYFPANAMMNKRGYDSIDEVMTRGVKGLTVDEFEAAMKNDVYILDTRHQNHFVKGFIPGSIFIGIDGSFAMWVGALLTDLKKPILFIAEDGREEEVVRRLARVGYDYAIGYLDGGLDAWKEAGKTVESITSISAQEMVDANPTRIIDVRKPGEFDAQHVNGAQHIPLDYIWNHLSEMPSEDPTYVHCAGGYRSVIAISIWAANGRKNLVNIEGGFKAIAATNIALSEPSSCSV